MDGNCELVEMHVWLEVGMLGQKSLDLESLDLESLRTSFFLNIWVHDTSKLQCMLDMIDEALDMYISLEAESCFVLESLMGESGMKKRMLQVDTFLQYLLSVRELASSTIESKEHVQNVTKRITEIVESGMNNLVLLDGNGQSYARVVA